MLEVRGPNTVGVSLLRRNLVREGAFIWQSYAVPAIVLLVLFSRVAEQTHGTRCEC